jgi:hypothetical protein
LKSTKTEKKSSSIRTSPGIEAAVLKITSRISPSHAVFELEGKLAGPWVEELRDCWSKGAVSDRPVRVMLCAVTFVDHEGKRLLAEMHRQGAELVAEGCMNQVIVERILQGEYT